MLNIQRTLPYLGKLSKSYRGHVKCRLFFYSVGYLSVYGIRKQELMYTVYGNESAGTLGKSTNDARQCHKYITYTVYVNSFGIRYTQSAKRDMFTSRIFLRKKADVTQPLMELCSYDSVALMISLMVCNVCASVSAATCSICSK